MDNAQPIPSDQLELQTDWKGRFIAAIRGQGLQYQLIAAVTKDEVVPIAYAASPFRCVGESGMDNVRQLIGKVHLRRKLKTSSRNRCRPDFKMNVYGPDRVPARVDGQELCGSFRISQLMATQELPPDRVEPRILDIRIDACCVAVPDIDLCTR